jgi:hypothetical protein
LWLYLVPPSEPPAEPYGADYPRWALECAAVAKEYPCVAGICIDDFSRNADLFSPSYCRDMGSPAQNLANPPSRGESFGYYESVAVTFAKV